MCQEAEVVAVVGNQLALVVEVAVLIPLLVALAAAVEVVLWILILLTVEQELVVDPLTKPLTPQLTVAALH